MCGGTWPPFHGELKIRPDNHFPLDGTDNLIDALPAVKQNMGTTMFLKLVQSVGEFIARWGILFLLLVWAYADLFRSAPSSRASSGIAFISVAALLGAFSVASRHQRELLNAAYQVFLIGLLSHFALSSAGMSFGKLAVGQAVAACVVFVALVFFQLSWPVLLATSPQAGPQRELAVRIYWACFASPLVALAVGGALLYAVYSTRAAGTALLVGWSVYGYALFFIAVFSGTLAALLVPRVKLLPRPRLEGWQRFLPWPAGAFLLWGALDEHLSGRGWTLFLLGLVAFVGTSSAMYRALQRAKAPPDARIT